MRKKREDILHATKELLSIDFEHLVEQATEQPQTRQ